MTYILGINAFHGDAAACLLQHGKLVAAAEEERFRRIKHWAGFPSEAIAYCLKEAGISLAEVAHVAVNQDPSASFGRKLKYLLLQRPSLSLVLDRFRNKQKRASVADLLATHFPTQRFSGTVQQVEHHQAHLASAYLVSPFTEAVCVSVDGFGDFASAAWGLGRASQFQVDARVYFPHSLGIFYQALTQFLGFMHYGDEYKIMGLAPYGKPTYLPQLRQLVQLQPDGSFQLNLRYFRHHRVKISHEWEGGSPHFDLLYSDALVELLGPARQSSTPLTQQHQDLAHSVQAMYEEAFFHLLNHLHTRYQLPAVTLAGGCAMNSVANGKIALKTPFKQVYVQSAAGDAGGAIGAAAYVWHHVLGKTQRHVMTHAYWGPSTTPTEIAALLQQHRAVLQEQQCVVSDMANSAELCRVVAAAIADGKVIGWFQGRMEWGPRALGNRSILGDPRRANMKDILNLKIKRRESFRPFAPSVLREAVSEWFEQDAEVPFMMQVFQVREAKRAQVPAITHVDGSGRLQTVSKDTNALYHQLISTFATLTGVPMVLNTSFNENEPVVCLPEQALQCFLRTKMDVLVLGTYVVTRADTQLA